MVIRFQLDIGQGFFDVAPPINSKGLRPKVAFFDGVVQASLHETMLEWVGNEAVILQQYRADGNNGGVGIYEGPGVRVFACDAPGVMFVDGYLDLQGKDTRWECDMVSCQFKVKNKQWLEEKAGGIDFAYLFDLPVGTPGKIVMTTDVKLTPYTVTAVTRNDRAGQKMLILTTSFLTIRELYDVSCKVIQLTSEIIGWTGTTGATLGATLLSLLSMFVQIGAYAVYIGLLLFSLITMIINIVKEVLQLKKYKMCMLDRVLMQRVAEYFGMNLSSTILQQSNWKNSTYMPPKNVIPDAVNPLNVFRRYYDESQNFPNSTEYRPYPEMNVSEYIRELCEFYRAGISIIGNTLYFEKIRHFNQVSVFTIPNTGPVGYTFNLPHPSRTNASEIPSNIFLSFAWENTGDANNLHRYKGTSVSITVSPITTNNVQRVGHTFGKVIRWPVARACRKYHLSEVEEVLNALINLLFTVVNTVINLINALISVVNAIIAIFGGNANTVPTIPTLPLNIFNNRIGWMELSDDTTSAPKRFLGEQVGADWVVSLDNDVYMTADAIGEEFHFSDLATRGAQANIYDKNTFGFCCEDFANIVNTNCVTTPNGLIGKFRGEFNWNIETEEAQEVEYEEYVNFTNNLKETKKVD